jgi:hypothetical protein
MRILVWIARILPPLAFSPFFPCLEDISSDYNDEYSCWLILLSVELKSVESGKEIGNYLFRIFWEL